MEAHSLRRKLVKGRTLHRLVFHFEGACGLWLRERGVVMIPLSSPCSPESKKEWLQVLAVCVRCMKRQNEEHALVLLVLHDSEAKQGVHEA
jgi:hypothetical protein